MVKRTQYAEIGTIISGTLRPEDLIEAFQAELDYQLRHRNMSLEQRERDRLFLLVDAESHTEDDSEQLLEDLCDALNIFSPPYAYFYSHPGDGADFGYWPMLETVSDDVRDGTLRQFDNFVPDDYRGEFVVVNDHGNMTCGRVEDDGSVTEYWSCV